MTSSPGLTAVVKHDDHALTRYDHGDSYSPWHDHGKIMAWTLSKIYDDGMVIMENSKIMPWSPWQFL